MRVNCLLTLMIYAVFRIIIIMTFSAKEIKDFQCYRGEVLQASVTLPNAVRETRRIRVQDCLVVQVVQ